MSEFSGINDAVIPTYFPRILFRELIEDGISEEYLFKEVGFSFEDLLNDDYRISFQQLKHLITYAITVSEDEHLGWRFAQRINITALDVLGYAIMSSNNVESAIVTLTNFLAIRAPSFNIELVEPKSNEEPRELIVKERFDFKEIRYFMISCVIGAFDNVFRFLTQENNIISKVEIACVEPHDWDQQSKKIHYPIIFSSDETRIFIEPSFINNALPTANPDTEQSTQLICKKILAEVENQSGTVHLVSKYITNSPHSFPSLTETANSLNMSPRTLRRKLQESGTTFQKILDEVRTKVAKELLINKNKSISEVAFELGFQDTSNFNRAFKSWTGMSPGKLRR